MTNVDLCVTIHEKPLALQKHLHVSYIVEGGNAGGFYCFTNGMTRDCGRTPKMIK